jgi:hypothetical protein
MADRQLVAAEPIHAELLADDLFPITAREARLLTGKPPLDALLESLGLAEEAWTYLIDVGAGVHGGRAPPSAERCFRSAVGGSTPRIYRAKIGFLGSPAPWPKSGWSGSMSSEPGPQRE